MKHRVFQKTIIFTLLILCFASCAKQKDNSSTSIDVTDPEPSISAETLDNLNRLWKNSFPDSQKNNSWFKSEVLENWDNTIIFEAQINQDNDDVEAALQLADSYYPIASSLASASNLTIARYDIMVVNNGAPVASISTENGEKYSIVKDGNLIETEFNR